MCDITFLEEKSKKDNVKIRFLRRFNHEYRSFILRFKIISDLKADLDYSRRLQVAPRTKRGLTD